MSAAIELSVEELALITTAREVQAQKDAVKAEQEAKRAAEQLAAKNKEIAIILEMTQALVDVDSTNVLSVNPITNFITFVVNGDSIQVGIEDHYVSTNYYGRGKSTKKYLLSNSFNGYKQTWYKNPKSVIKKVIEMIEFAEAKNRREAIAANVNDIATEIVRDLHPRFEVIFQPAYSYKSGRFNTKSDVAKIIVTTPRGTITYVPKMVEGEVTVVMVSVAPSSNIRQQVADLILGE